MTHEPGENRQWATVGLPAGLDVLAPDGSQIRLLSRIAGGSMGIAAFRGASPDPAHVTG
jgi:hypothetical protein